MTGKQSYVWLLIQECKWITFFLPTGLAEIKKDLVIITTANLNWELTTCQIPFQVHYMDYLIYFIRWLVECKPIIISGRNWGVGKLCFPPSNSWRQDLNPGSLIPEPAHIITPFNASHICEWGEFICMYISIITI